MTHLVNLPHYRSSQLGARPRYCELLCRRTCSVNRRSLHLISLNLFSPPPVSITVVTPLNPNIYNHTTRPTKPPLPLPSIHPDTPQHALILHDLSCLPSPSSPPHPTHIHFVVNHKDLPTSHNVYSHFNTILLTTILRYICPPRTFFSNPSYISLTLNTLTIW